MQGTGTVTVLALSQHPALLTARRCSDVPRVSVLLHTQAEQIQCPRFPLYFAEQHRIMHTVLSVPYCVHLVNDYFTVQESFKSRVHPRVSAPNESLKICICDSRLSQVDESDSGRMLGLVLEKKALFGYSPCPGCLAALAQTPLFQPWARRSPVLSTRVTPATALLVNRSGLD